MHPLPQLGAADLGGCRIFHQVEEWHAADAAQPGFNVSQSHSNILLEPCVGDLPVGDPQQIFGDRS